MFCTEKPNDAKCKLYTKTCTGKLNVDSIEKKNVLLKISEQCQVDISKISSTQWKDSTIYIIEDTKNVRPSIAARVGNKLFILQLRYNEGKFNEVTEVPSKLWERLIKLNEFIASLDIKVNTSKLLDLMNAVYVHNSNEITDD